ncbi:MAG: hypothetical protein ABIK65_04415 [Candidatus Eisenbacteria bacterium]
MTSIDLIPQETHTRREARRRLRAWGRRLALGAAAGAALYVGLVRMAESGNAELVRMSGRYATLQDRLRQAESLIAERDRLSEHRQAIQAIRRGPTMGSHLEAIGGSLPEECFLTRLDLDLCAQAGSKGWTGLGSAPCIATLRVRGTAPDHPEVGRIIRGMFDTGRFEEVALVSVDETPGRERAEGVEFEIFCTLTAGTGSP